MNDHTCWLVDDVEYSLPFEPFSSIFSPYIEHRLERMFAWRHEVTLAAMLKSAGGAPSS
jgi:hypothetical protein